MSAALFVYGSLRDEAVFKEVVGAAKPLGLPAKVMDYALSDPIAGYPAVCPMPGGQVEGEYLSPLSHEAIARIDEYEDEGADYRRVLAQVEVEGETREAYLYVGMK